MRRSGNGGGFTLLELLISSGLLTVLLITTWASYVTASRSMVSVMSRFDLYLKVITFRRGFINALQSVTPYPQTANSKADFKGESKKLSFTTLSAPWPVSTSAPISQVTWVEFNKNAAGKHYIGAHPYYFLSDAHKDDAERHVQEQVKSWEFGYSDGSVWSTTWDFSLKRKLPQQIRVKYTIQEEKREIEDSITVAIAQEADPARAQGVNPFAGQPVPPGGSPFPPVPNPPPGGTPGPPPPPLGVPTGPANPQAGMQFGATP